MPGFQAALAAVAVQNANILIIESLDRLSRDKVQLAKLGKLFAEQSITLHTCESGPIEVAFQMNVIFAEMLRAQRAIASKRGMAIRDLRQAAGDNKPIVKPE